MDLFCQVKCITPALEWVKLGDKFLYEELIDQGYVFEDVSSLVKCVFSSNGAHQPLKRRNIAPALWKMLSDLHHVKILHLCKSYIQVNIFRFKITSI